MDGSKFDELARSLGHGVSRRKMLRGLAGGLAGALTGGVVARKEAGAAAREIIICHATGDPNAPYQSLTIPQAEMNLHARHGDFVRVECCADGDCPNQYGECGSGTCDNGYCVQLPVAAGTPCDAGLACVIGGICDGTFNCAGSGAPVDCPETDNPCTTSICSEEAGGCQTVNLDDGTTCGIDDACTSYACSAGTCVGTSRTDCTGDCDDCNGVCTNLDGDLDNCGTCGHACEDLGSCLTTTCVSPGICLNTPVDCPGGDQCNTAACQPDTGCYLQPKTGASCTIAGSTEGTCGEDGACHPICLGTEICSTDDDCSENQHCFNGGCFTLCSIGSCSSTSCSTCQCTFDPDRSANFVCVDNGFGIGVCATNADCPTGSFCNPSFGAGGGEKPYLCTRPCLYPPVPV